MLVSIMYFYLFLLLQIDVLILLKRRYMDSSARSTMSFIIFKVSCKIVFKWVGYYLLDYRRAMVGNDKRNDDVSNRFKKNLLMFYYNLYLNIMTDC